MALRVTRFDEAYFDDGHFDGDYGSDNTLIGVDAFPEDVHSDVDEILQEWGQWFTINTLTKTTDCMGDITAETATPHKANGIVQDITRKDLKINEMGLSVAGNIKGFFKKKYCFEETAWEPAEGELLTDRDGTIWRIEKIIGERRVSALNNYTAFIVLDLKNIDMAGSEV